MAKRIIPTTITEEELIKIVSTKGLKKHHKVAFLLGFYQCLRVSEVVNLTLGNVKVKEHYIEIKEGKGHKDRDIVIMKPMKLKPLTIVYALNHLPIGCGVRALQIAFKNYARRILNKNLHFHCLRHSGASWLINKKRWDIRQVQRFLGHSKIQTTEIYTHIGSTDLVNLEWDEE